MRRTKEEALETRNRILDSAEQVFMEKGVSNTSLAQLAEAAGVTRGAIYWHFKNKADLFDAMMSRVVLPMEEMAARAGDDNLEDPLAYALDDSYQVKREFVDDLMLRIVDLEKDIFETINRAKLVITISAQDVPKDFTLELFVTDPLSNECGPFSSVIFNEGDEIGVLQQSVDFRSGMKGSQKAVFYSLRPVYASNVTSGTYTVKAMLRHNGNDANVPLPHPVTVNCNVDLPYISGPDAHKGAKREITSAGFIKKIRRSGQMNSSTPYKNMWPWEPVYHYDRFVCDFKIDGDKISDLRTYDMLPTAPPGTVTTPSISGRDGQELKIDSIRNRSGN